MATLTLQPQDTTLSLSTNGGLRAPYSSAHPPSMADSLPAVNFGFDDLRDRMNAFTARFDDFIERGRKRVLEERNSFRMSVTDLQEGKRQRERSIAAISSKNESHAESLSLQTAETNEMHSAISSLSSTRDTRGSTVSTLRSRIATAKSAIAAKKEQQRQHRVYLDSQAARNGPELTFWEGHLGLRIEGAGKEDRLRFCFSCVDDRMAEREALFELDMEDRDGGREYEVVLTKPRLDPERVEACVGGLCETRDFGLFLKAMRVLFVESMK